MADKLRCLYLFSGKRRVGDLRECLAASLKCSEATLVMREIDAERGRRNQNLLSAKLQNALMAEVVAGKFDLVVASPPCSTFSRARSASVSGPPPLRSRLHARGFPWLSKLARAQVASSSRLVDFTIKLLEAHGSLGAPRRFGPTSRTVPRQLRSGNGRQCRHWRQKWTSSPGHCTNATSVQCI